MRSFLKPYGTARHRPGATIANSVTAIEVTEFTAKMRAVVITTTVGIAVGCAADMHRRPRLFAPAFRGGHDPNRRAKGPWPYPSKGLTCAQVLAEADTHFTYFGKPIHPALLNEFECWVSDQNPVTLAVDVSAAFDTNEYGQPVTRSPLGTTYETTHGEEVRRRCYYSYERIGALEDNVHVLKTANYGGGTGVFIGLLLVRFELSRGYYQDGAPYDRLVMRLVRDWPLGDRFNGTVRVLSDRVVVRRSGGSIAAVLRPDGNK